MSDVAHRLPIGVAPGEFRRGASRRFSYQSLARQALRNSDVLSTGRHVTITRFLSAAGVALTEAEADTSSRLPVHPPRQAASARKPPIANQDVFFTVLSSLRRAGRVAVADGRTVTDM